MPLLDPSPLGRLPFDPPPNPAPEFIRFWELWREERFWACHEALEEAWLHEPDLTRKRFLQGLIHGAVAVFQFRRGNFVGAARQLARARARLQASLEPDQTVREGVDTARFLEGVTREIEPALESLSNSVRADVAALEARLRLELSARVEPGREPAA